MDYILRFIGSCREGLPRPDQNRWESITKLEIPIHLGWLGRDRVFDPLRSDPRFIALLKKLGLEG